jgi:D-glycero-alpha-D-manno-heptose 1-phosphate guanylyltransferase
MNELKQIECIILAGGLGTRLRSAVPDLPKCMAPIAGKPFLAYLLDYLLAQQVTKFIFSLGYMHEVIEDFIKSNYPQIQYQIALESEPLGTGGAIRLACEYTTEENVIVMNGDTMFRVDVQSLLKYHSAQKSDCTLSLKTMHQFDRYGVVETDAENNITSFKEKKQYDSGNINGGVYALHVPSFKSIQVPEKFSFEKDYLENYFNEIKMVGYLVDGYFIDIGIPEDFEKAGREFGNI